MVVHAIALLAMLARIGRTATLTVNTCEDLVLTWRVRYDKLTFHLVPQVSDVDALTTDLSRGIW